VSLTWGGIKRLTRLQGIAEEFALVARDHPPAHVERVLADLIDETYDVLQDADDDLSEEFSRIVGEGKAAEMPADVHASVLSGWFIGAVAAETLEVRIRTGVGGGRRSRSLTRDNGG
jgi:hypothetical protein